MNKPFAAIVAALGLSAAIASAAPTPSFPTPDWRAGVRELAASHFKNPAWGYSHCLRDYALAKELAAADHAAVDDDVLFAASFLHDMAAFPPWEDTKTDHSDVGARLVDTVLKGTGFPMEKIDAVRGAIRTHMYYRDPVGSEALYLHDADALDWLGAVGVGGIIGLVDPHGGNPDALKSVGMLTDNLNKVPTGVRSSAGRARAPAGTRHGAQGGARDLPFGLEGRDRGSAHAVMG